MVTSRSYSSYPPPFIISAISTACLTTEEGIAVYTTYTIETDQISWAPIGLDSVWFGNLGGKRMIRGQSLR